jgi:hypothetical protein
MALVSSMKLIETKTLGTAAASIEFTSIPQTPYTDLLLMLSIRGDATNVANSLDLALNGSTASFTSRLLEGNGSSATSVALANFAGNSTNANSTSNIFSNIQVYIPNYTGNTNKTFSIDAVTENNATTAYQDLIAGVWASTAAITSIRFTQSTGNSVVGSVISLYGITKGSDGIVTVS